MTEFLRRETASPLIKGRVARHPLSSVRDCSLSTFANKHHLKAILSIRSLRTCRALLTYSHLKWVQRANILECNVWNFRVPVSNLTLTAVQEMNSLALKDDSTWIFSNGSLRTSNLQDSNYHSSYFIYLAVVTTTRVMQRSMVRWRRCGKPHSWSVLSYHSRIYLVCLRQSRKSATRTPSVHTEIRIYSIDQMCYKMEKLPVALTFRRILIFAPWTFLRCPYLLIHCGHTFCNYSQLY